MTFPYQATIGIYKYLSSDVFFPSGYIVKKVKGWDNALMRSYGYNEYRGSGVPLGQFQVVNLYIVGYDPSKGETPSTEKWVGSWSAITGYNKLSHPDVMNLARSQLFEHATWLNMTNYEIMNISEADLKTKYLDMILPDGYSIHNKMNQLAGGNGCVMWSADGKSWLDTVELRYGTMVNGGQPVAVLDVPKRMTLPMPNGIVETHDFYEVFPFSRIHFGQSHESYPYLGQWETTITATGVVGDTIRGHVYCPVALNPKEFDFAGNFVPTKYYLPDVFLEDFTP